MAYTINLTDGTVFATIADGTVNSIQSGTPSVTLMTLIGKNYAGYGQFIGDNFIHLLENGANGTQPPSPLTGQLWWDKTNNLMKVYNGSIWKVMTGSTSSASTPTSSIVGDLWYDSTNQQLKVCSVAGTPGTFIIVGPAYSSSQGTSGAIPLSINDNGGTPHIVTALYANNSLVSIISPDSDFIPAAPYATNFPKIYKGTTVWNLGVNSGNISNPGNVTLTSGGNTTVVVTDTGVNITGYANVSGNLSAGNISTTSITGSVISISGNIIAGNVNSVGLSLSGNVLSALNSTSNITTTANISGGNIKTANVLVGASTISALGNITAGNLLAAGLSLSGNVLSALNSTSAITTTANITGGNILFGTGIVSGTGNVSGGYIFGNGSQLTGLSAAVSVSQIQNGNSNVRIASADGNVTVGVNSVNNVVTISQTQLIAANISTNDIAHSGTTLTGNVGASSNYFNTVFANTGTFNGTIAVNGANITGTVINNSGGNGVGNIGSTSKYFNTIFATATTALYADVAERFAADEVYEPGTVVELGGINEITRSVTDLSENVFGVISTRPAFTMNGGAGENDTHPAVAMTGRVPVKVIGIVNKGDRLVGAGNGLARAAKPGEATAFNVIGRSLVSKTTLDEGTIEAIVTIK
jgi:hypothetical protein